MKAHHQIDRPRGGLVSKLVRSSPTLMRQARIVIGNILYGAWSPPPTINLVFTFALQLLAGLELALLGHRERRTGMTNKFHSITERLASRLESPCHSSAEIGEYIANVAVPEHFVGSSQLCTD